MIKRISVWFEKAVDNLKAIFYYVRNKEELLLYMQLGKDSLQIIQQLTVQLKARGFDIRIESTPEGKKVTLTEINKIIRPSAYHVAKSDRSRVN